MPYLTLSLEGFRNLACGAIDLSAREVFFVGANGQGKTSLLEALYYSAYGASFRTHRDEEIIKDGGDGFSLSALYEYGTAKETENASDKGLAVRVDVLVGQGTKKITKNGKAVKDRKDLIDEMACVLFCHDDMRFATGAPENRRFFLNQVLSMCDALYLDDLRGYNKVLKSRNAILKAALEGDKAQYEMLDIFDVQMAEKGVLLQKKRRTGVFVFNTVFTSLYKEIAGIDGVSLEYRPSWNMAGEENEERARLCLVKSRERDKYMAVTMTGPHRDRLEVIYTPNGGQKKPFAPVASTGQLRLCALLLRVAQARAIRLRTGKRCVLLMDDVMLELDTKKRQSFTGMLNDYDQMFCTFLPDEPYQKYQKSNTVIYQIENGSWVK